MHYIKRSNYVSKMWRRVDEFDPTDGDNPLDYCWQLGDDGLQPEWFDGNQLPDPNSITSPEEDLSIYAQSDASDDSEGE